MRSSRIFRCRMGRECRVMKTSEKQKILLAVDLGLRAGLAWFAEDGRLLRARSTHFANRSVLRRALQTIWSEVPGVTHVVLEGGGPLADIWKKSAERQGISVTQIAAEDWRRDILLPSQQGDGPLAKSIACRMARAIAQESGCAPATTLVDDAAEAIVFGQWFCRKRPVQPRA